MPRLAELTQKAATIKDCGIFELLRQADRPSSDSKHSHWAYVLDRLLFWPTWQLKFDGRRAPLDLPDLVEAINRGQAALLTDRDAIREKVMPTPVSSLLVFLGFQIGSLT